MTIKVGEIGKIININAAFDLSGNTELQLSFTKPDGSILVVTSSDGVSAPPVDFVDPATGETFSASEYWSYATSSGDIDRSGLWKVHGRYIDATPKEFCGNTASFTVLPC